MFGWKAWKAMSLIFFLLTQVYIQRSNDCGGGAFFFSFLAVWHVPGEKQISSFKTHLLPGGGGGTLL